jgi:hypothetical protein
MTLLLGIPVLAGLVLVVLYLAGEIGRPIVYRLPGGYRGWAGIRYEDPTCPPLRTEGWYLVIPVGPDGRGCTSSPVPGGWRYSRYEYIYPDGRRRELSGPGEKVLLVGATGPQKPHVGTLFVGSDEELKRSWSHGNDVVREMQEHVRDK